MLQIDLWKRFVIWGMVALGLLMALPNGFYSRVEAHNDAVVAIERGADTVENRALVETWPGWMPSSLVNLGLDLRGGSHFLKVIKLKSFLDFVALPAVCNLARSVSATTIATWHPLT